MAKKAVIGLVAGVLIGVVCAGAIVALVNSNKKGKSDSDDGSSSMGTSSKSMTAMCSSALYKESCERTLSQISTNSSASPADVFKIFVNYAIKEFELAAHNSAEATKSKLDGSDGITAAAASDCEKLLKDSLDNMKVVSSLAGKDITNLTSEADRIAHMVSSSMTYLYTCVDGFEDPKLKAEMNSMLNNATEMSSNVLGVITSMSSFMEKLDSDLNINPTQNIANRKLLGYDMDQHGFPTWLSAGDRKLLQAAPSNSPKPNAIVAQDGSGQFKTINDAIKAIPASHAGRYAIYVKAGIYDERVNVPRGKDNLLIYGDGSDKSIVTGKISNVVDKVTTMLTATFTVEANNFLAKDIGFRNTAGAINHQAVALRISGESGAFFRCRFDGFQDTLYAHTGTQFFRDCTISGTVDFIFGNSAAVFQNCMIICNRPLDNQQNTVTAHGRTDPNMKTGVVLQNCQIIADKALEADIQKIPSYLGRPWKLYSRAVVMESTISNVIRPEGWYLWDGDFALKTLYFAEYGNTGAAASTASRVKWAGFHVITKADATQFTAGPFINGNNWLAATGVPNYLGFKA